MRRIAGQLIAIAFVFTSSQAAAQLPSDLERDLARAFQSHTSDNTYIDGLTSGDESRAMQCMASIMVMANLVYQSREAAMRIDSRLSEARLQSLFWHWLNAHNLTQPEPNIGDLRNAAITRADAASQSTEATVEEMKHLADCWVQPAWISAPAQTPHLRTVMAGAGFIPGQFAVPDAQRERLRVLMSVELMSAIHLIPPPIEPADDSHEAIDAALNQSYATPTYVEARGALADACFERSYSFINYSEEVVDPQLRLSPFPNYTVVCERMP